MIKRNANISVTHCRNYNLHKREVSYNKRIYNLHDFYRSFDENHCRNKSSLVKGMSCNTNGEFCTQTFSTKPENKNISPYKDISNYSNQGNLINLKIAKRKSKVDFSKFVNNNIVSLRKAEVRLNLNSKEKFKEAIERSARRFKSRRHLYDISSLIKYKSVCKVEVTGKTQTKKKIIVIPQGGSTLTSNKADNVDKFLLKTALKDSSMHRANESKFKVTSSDNNNRKDLLTTRKYINKNHDNLVTKRPIISHEYIGSTKINPRLASGLSSSNSLTTYKSGLNDDLREIPDEGTPIPMSIVQSKQINRYLFQTKKNVE